MKNNFKLIFKEFSIIFLITLSIMDVIVLANFIRALAFNNPINGIW